MRGTRRSMRMWRYGVHEQLEQAIGETMNFDEASRRPVVNRGEERERMTGFITFKRRRAR
jgi:hypothetical protein